MENGIDLSSIVLILVLNALKAGPVEGQTTSVRIPVSSNPFLMSYQVAIFVRSNELMESWRTGKPIAYNYFDFDSHFALVHSTLSQLSGRGILVLQFFELHQQFLKNCVFQHLSEIELLVRKSSSERPFKYEKPSFKKLDTLVKLLPKRPCFKQFSCTLQSKYQWMLSEFKLLISFTEVRGLTSTGSEKEGKSTAIKKGEYSFLVFFLAIVVTYVMFKFKLYRRDDPAKQQQRRSTFQQSAAPRARRWYSSRNRQANRSRFGDEDRDTEIRSTTSDRSDISIDIETHLHQGSSNVAIGYAGRTFVVHGSGGNSGVFPLEHMGVYHSETSTQLKKISAMYMMCPPTA